MFREKAPLGRPQPRSSLAGGSREKHAVWTSSHSPRYPDGKLSLVSLPLRLRNWIPTQVLNTSITLT